MPAANSSTTSSAPAPDDKTLATALLDEARADNAGKLDLLSWAIVHRAYLKEGVCFDLARHPFLGDIYADTAREVVIYKASQMGASEYGITYALHAADERQATVLYVFPTDTHVSDFSTARIGPAIDASSYLAGIISEGERDDGSKRRKTDRVTLKRVRDRYMYLRGASVKTDGLAPQLKSIDADVLILDEVDEMDQRAPAIAVKRLGHSLFKEIRWISTPTYPGIGIHAKWLESDQREWMLRCGHCGTWQSLTIRHVVTERDGLERPLAWHGQDEGRAWAACEKCGQEIDRLAGGQWVARYPGREIVGYHLTKLFSYTTPLLAVVKALDTVDETKRREAFNQDLGEPYIPRGGRLTEALLDQCRRNYAHGPVAGERTVAGVDVGSLLYLVIRSANVDRETGERPQRLAVAVESFEEVGRLLRRYRVQTCVMDALPETRKARELQAAFRPGMVWLAYFVGQKTGLKTEDIKRVDDVEYVLNLDRTRSFDEMLAGIMDASQGEGGLTLPAHARDVRDYYTHLVNQVRVLEDTPDGNQVAVYRELGPDHYSLAELYCHAAAGMPRAASLPQQQGLQRQSSQWG